MHRSHVSAVTVALSLLAVGVVYSCSKKEEPKPVEPPKPVAVAPPPVEQPKPLGIGTIEGTVLFAGAAPQAQPLKRGVDPVCGKTAMNDETVLVNNGMLANVVVKVVGLPMAAPPSTPVIVDQVECMYRPRVQAAVQGQTVEVRNSDGTLHNVHTYEGTKTLFNQAQPAKAAAITKPLGGKEGVIKFKCDVHPWMTGYVVLASNPFFATTGTDGKFTIQNVPAGKYALEAWHEKLGIKKTEVEVKADGTGLATFQYQATDRG